MPNNSDTDPLILLINLNNSSREYLQKILSLALNQTHNNLNANNPNDNDIEKLNDWFTNKVPHINHAIITRLFPALIESMAGSDAVCIKGMANNYSDSTKKLDLIWQQSLQQTIKSKQLSQTNITELSNWATEYQKTIDFCNDEIIPMADRLLDNLSIKELKLYFDELNS